MTDLPFQSGDKVLFIGDSITDCGRRDEHAPLGNGYVSKVVDLITAKYPERRIEYVNKGIGGDVVEGLEERWDSDVIAEKPDWLSVKIGINNASRQLAAGVRTEEYLPKWEACYRRILSRVKDELDAELFMFEIFYIATDVAEPQPRPVDAYNEVIHRLSDQFKRKTGQDKRCVSSRRDSTARGIVDHPRWHPPESGRSHTDGVGVSEAGGW